MILKSSVWASRGDINLVHVGNYIFYDVNHIQKSQAGAEQVTDDCSQYRLELTDNYPSSRFLHLHSVVF